MICLTLFVATAAPVCEIKPGPPCVSVFDPRLRTEACIIHKGACFTVGMEDQGDTVIVSALYNIHPSCSHVSSSTEMLKLKADEYIATLQSSVPSTNVEVHDCIKTGYVDIVLHELGGHHPPE